MSFLNSLFKGRSGSKEEIRPVETTDRLQDDSGGQPDMEDEQEVQRPSAETDDQSAENDICTDKCPHHQKDVIKYYCPTHDSLGCGVCIMIDHRNCEGVVYIPMVAAEYTSGEEFAEYRKELENLREKTDTVMTASKGNLPKAENNFTEAIQAVETFKKEKIAKLAELENTLKKKATNCKNENLGRLNTLIMEASRAQNEVLKMLADIETLVKQKQFCKLYIEMKMTKVQISNLHESLEKLEQSNFLKTYKLVPGKRKLEVYDSLDEVETSENPGTSNGFRSAEQEVKRPRLMEVANGSSDKNPQFFMEIAIKSDSDQNIVCKVVGMAALQGNRLVIADMNNSKVKLIDTLQRKIISEIQTPSVPFGLTVINDKQVAVSLKCDHRQMCDKILIIKVERSLLIERLVKYSILFEGNIVYFKNKFLAIHEDRCRISILDMVGDDSSVDLGDYTYGTFVALAVDASKNFVYVVTTEHPNSCTESYVLRKSTLGEDLTSLNAIQNVVYSDLYQIQHLADQNGSVFLLGPGSVEVMDQQGSEPYCLLSQANGVFCPGSLTFDAENKKLFLGMRDNNYIRVFKMP